MVIMKNKSVVESPEYEDIVDPDTKTDLSTEENLTDEDSDDADVSSDEDVAHAGGNLGWADSISKILKTNKPKKKKCIVLSKAKKLNDVKKLKPIPAGFQVETVDGKVKEEQLEPENDNKSVDEPLKKKRKDLPKLRVKPDILERQREKTLQKIATKGVVQLFNAVRMQQKDISRKLEQAGPLEVRKEKVLKNIDKRAFLDVLMGEKSEKTEDHAQVNKKENESSKEPGWNVLRDDFMLSAKMKDWDKELEVEEEAEVLSE